MIEQKYLEIYRELLVHRDDIYAQQTPKGSYFLRRSPVTEELIRSHMEGSLTAGWYALASTNTTKWVVLDADREDGIEQLQQAWHALSNRGLASHLELSRRGGHLWTLFDPISARVARRLVLSTIGIHSDVEVFPKQDRLTSETRVGSLVRGPLGIHRLTGSHYPFVDPISLRPLSQSAEGTLDYLAGAPRISLAQAGEQLAALLEEASVPASAQKEPSGGSTPLAPGLKRQLGDLYTFVSRYVELDGSGRGHCPFHPPDTHPSFVVDRERGFWICFHEVNPQTGRYLGGDAVAFYRRLKNLSYRETVRELEELVKTNEI